jgi:hypothetical protein
MTTQIAHNVRHGGQEHARDVTFDYLDKIPEKTEAELRPSRRELDIISEFGIFDNDEEPIAAAHEYGWDDVRPGDRIRVQYSDTYSVEGVASLREGSDWYDVSDGIAERHIGCPEDGGTVSLVSRRHAHGTRIVVRYEGEDMTLHVLRLDNDRGGWVDEATDTLAIKPGTTRAFAEVVIAYTPDQE